MMTLFLEGQKKALCPHPGEYTMSYRFMPPTSKIQFLHRAASSITPPVTQPSQAERCIALGQTMLDGGAKAIRDLTEVGLSLAASIALYWLGFATPIKRG
ncbi:hypothetical protein HY478_01015 [Candidatus Uhrbacteria bacterium]|nr:hypothetical protein [Candidatus Uhrbacteria bacterium]